MIAALYVEKDGPYYGIDGVDPWDQERDARLYRGPHRVIAHPPCQRWGRYWSGGPSAKTRRMLGDDDGCFAAALWAVRTFGGILEHPADTSAWKWFGLKSPLQGLWLPAGDGRGYTCQVEQGNYGHKAAKRTWLYAVDCDVFDLDWTASGKMMRLDEGFHSREERQAARSAGIKPVERLSKKQRTLTPTPFRDLLIDLVNRQ